MKLPALIVAIVLFFPSLARADMFKDCNQSADRDLSIAGCTLALRTGRIDTRNRAIIHLNRGNAYVVKKEYDRAIADFDEAIRLMPSMDFAWNGRGNAWHDKHEIDRALADYDKAIQLNPKNVLAYSNRCRAWRSKGDLDKALADCQQAVRLDPKNTAALNGRTVVWVDRGELDRAIEDATEVIRLSPKWAFPYINRGNALREKGELDKYLDDLNTAIRLDPSNAIVFNNRGNFWMNFRNDLDRAMADFDEAIRLDAKYVTAFANRGEAWRLKGDLGRALADQDEAIRMNHDDTAPLIRRGDTLRYMGEFGRALSDYDRALMIDKENIAAFTGRGLTYERMGDLARARVEFLNAVNSKTLFRVDINKSSLATAQARLAALDSGAAQPAIAPVPAKVETAGAIPTSAVAVPAASSAPQPQMRRIALVIGNSSYRNVATLANPQRDAAAVAAALRNVGFQSVTLESDTTRENLINVLRKFANEAEQADWAMVYYAGHGIEVNGQNHLIPVDARLATDRDVQFETVPLDQVMTALEGARKLRLVVLDACRDNPFTPQMRRTVGSDVVAAASTAGGSVGTRSVGRGLGEVKVSGASLVVFAAKHGQTALDGQGGNSPFATALVQRMATPGVEINKIFRLVRDDVMEATAGRQEPYTYGSLPGREDFFFARM